ncbi:MAG: hypothetical protein ABSD77_07660 [Verrucomicrobiota bacterium]
MSDWQGGIQNVNQKATVVYFANPHPHPGFASVAMIDSRGVRLESGRPGKQRRLLENDRAKIARSDGMPHSRSLGKVKTIAEIRPVN